VEVVEHHIEMGHRLLVILVVLVVEVEVLILEEHHFLLVEQVIPQQIQITHKYKDMLVGKVATQQTIWVEVVAALEALEIQQQQIILEDMVV
jgi:hypothetical protein